MLLFPSHIATAIQKSERIKWKRKLREKKKSNKLLYKHNFVDKWSKNSMNSLIVYKMVRYSFSWLIYCRFKMCFPRCVRIDAKLSILGLSILSNALFTWRHVRIDTEKLIDPGTWNTVINMFSSITIKINNSPLNCDWIIDTLRNLLKKKTEMKKQWERKIQALAMKSKLKGKKMRTTFFHHVIFFLVISCTSFKSICHYHFHLLASTVYHFSCRNICI